MWLRHWNLVRDPFTARGGYIATPSHDEAVARLVHAIRGGEPTIRVEGGAGSGKSTVLNRALTVARSPGSRVAPAIAPVDGPDLLAQLARAVRPRAGVVASVGASWRILLDAARLVQAQAGRLLLVIDDARSLGGDEDRRHLDRLSHLDRRSTQVIIVDRPDGESPDRSDAFPVPIPALSRTEADHYLATKLRLAGRDGPTFAPRAMTRLHAEAGGVPARLDRLAGLALRAAAVESSPIIGPEIVAALAESIDPVRLRAS